MANTNKGRKLYISTTVADGPLPEAQSVGMVQSGFEALDWTQVKHVGSITGMGTQENIVNYDELETDVIQKSKGLSNAGDPEVECARTPADNGQKAMRAAGLTKLNYAFKITDDDIPSGGTTPTTYYNLGMVTGPVRPGGRAEDFILETFTLALNQREIVVDPT
jgi:hypothetical protein